MKIQAKRTKIDTTQDGLEIREKAFKRHISVARIQKLKRHAYSTPNNPQSKNMPDYIVVPRPDSNKTPLNK